MSEIAKERLRRQRDEEVASAGSGPRTQAFGPLHWIDISI